MNEGAAPTGFARISTGRAEADAVLNGGFPANSINVLMGQPGTGKTILAEQILFHNADEHSRGLYLATLSEPLAKLVTYLQAFRFFDADKLGSAIVYEDIAVELATDGIRALLPRLREAIRTMSPRFIIIDSFRALHDLGATTAEFRRMSAEMAGLVAAYRTTVFLVGEYREEDISSCPEFAVADGIVQLARRGTRRLDERYLRVLKLRGSAYAEGPHAFEITDRGIEVYRRLVAPRVPAVYGAPGRRVPSGVPGLDGLLDGGLWAGTSTLLTGGAGTGKTTIALQFAIEGARRGEKCLFLNLQENPAQLARTSGAFSGDIAALRDRGLDLVYHSPVELHIDRVAKDILARVEANELDRVVIDSLGDLALAAEDDERFHDFLYSVVQHLTASGITSVLTLERPPGRPFETRVSSISDGIIELGVEATAAPRRTLRIVKARGVAHDLRTHELVLGGGGAAVRESAA